MHRFWDDIGGTRYTSANIMCFPCKGGPHRLPFTSLISTATPFHRLKCFPPSPNSNNASICSASAHPPGVSSPQNVALRQLSVEEEAELKDLALDLVNHMPPSVGSERTVIHHCCIIVYGPTCGWEPLSDTHCSELYSALKGRIYKRKLALTRSLVIWGGTEAVQEVGSEAGSLAKQMQMSSMIPLRHQAEASGCLSHRSWLFLSLQIQGGVVLRAGLPEFGRQSDDLSYLQTIGPWLFSTVWVHWRVCLMGC